LPEDALGKYWKKWMQDELDRYYLEFYSDEEADAIETEHWSPKAARERRRRTYERLIPIMGQHGWKLEDGCMWVKTTQRPDARVEK
jgi:hypothetical protein